MSAGQDLKDLVGQIEKYLKALLALGGVTYILGFLVVAVYLSRYQLTPYGVVRFQYGMAGAWMILPLVFAVSVAVWTAAVYHNFSELWKKKLGWRVAWLFVKLLLVAGVVLYQGVMFVQVCSRVTPHLASRFAPVSTSDLFSVGGYCVALAFFFVGAWVSLSNVRTDPERTDYGSLWLGIGCVIGALLVFVVYLGFFSVNLYPAIPAEVGGGRTIEMRVMLEKDKETSEIQKILGITEERALSPVLGLILTTDRSYFVSVPNEGEGSIEVPRDIVSLAVFGSYADIDEKSSNKCRDRDALRLIHDWLSRCYSWFGSCVADYGR